MAKNEIDRVFTTIEEATVAQQAYKGPRPRVVYRCELDGQPAVFAVGINANKARATASRHFGIKVTPAVSAQRGPKAPVNVIDKIATMSADELAKVREILARMEAGTVEPTVEPTPAPAPKKGKKS